MTKHENPESREANRGHGRDTVYHHGRSPACWFGSMVTLAAFVIGTFAFIGSGLNEVVLGVALAVQLVALVGARILQVMGLGQPDHQPIRLSELPVPDAR